MAQAVTRIQSTLPFKLPDGDMNGAGGGMGWPLSMAFVVAAPDRIPPHWSSSRDIWIRNFYRTVDALNVATETFISKATGIELWVAPKDNNVKRHMEQASQFTYALHNQTGVFAGFEDHFTRYIDDYLSQDNGAFMVVMGRGRADGPIIGPATGLYHLDSARCQRTGNAEYPVIYHHTDSKRYKIHYTRIISQVQRPSPKQELYGVGFCAISSCIDASIELKDVSVHSQESLGSRPARQILYVKEGATLQEVIDAADIYQAKQDSMGVESFSKTMFLAPRSPAGKLELELLRMLGPHEGFNRMEVSIINLATIAGAFGLDLRDLAISFGIASEGATSAEVQDRKGRGKGVNTFIEGFRKELDRKFLPRHLKSVFDNKDDQQDEHQARIWDIRSSVRERDLRNGVTSVRTEREKMVESGEITTEQFEAMELQDGRLANGTDILLLFETSDQEIADLLSISGVSNPTDLKANDPESTIDSINEQIRVVWRVIDMARTAGIASKARQSLAALEKLRATYEGELMEMQMMEEASILEEEVLLEAAGEGEDAATPEDDVATVEEDAQLEEDLS